MKNTEEDHFRYTANGYKDRDDYLTGLADDWGIDRMAVRMIADMLGPSEDFDGLISELEDFEYLGLFEGLNHEEEDDDD
ncbi:MAG: hypothetical protein LBK62_06225, partial [Treponema sp.]|nr:hypothetical protein [Treponema sp.]